MYVRRMWKTTECTSPFFYIPGNKILTHACGAIRSRTMTGIGALLGAGIQQTWYRHRPATISRYASGLYHHTSPSFSEPFISRLSPFHCVSTYITTYSPMLAIVVSVITTCVLWHFTRNFYSRSRLDNIPGPPSASWITGWCSKIMSSSLTNALKTCREPGTTVQPTGMGLA